MSGKWWKTAINAAVAAMLFTPQLDGHAALRLRPAERGELRLEQNGTPVADEQPRFVVQEWQGVATKSATSKNAASKARVGSIVDMPDIKAQLRPLGDGWSAPYELATQREGDRYVQRWRFANGITVSALWEQVGDAIRVTGEVMNETPSAGREEIPISLILAIPVDEASLEWLADLRRTDSIRGNEEKISAVPTTAGSRAAMSRYPFAAVRGKTKCLAVGLPLDSPRIHRVRWDGKHGCLIAEIDVALSSVPEKFPNRASFTFWLFDFPREFGFRGAAQTYYALNPTSYAKRLPEQGQWMPFTQIDKVTRAQDFCFKFHEYHPDISVAWDWKHGVLPLVYCEPPVQYINLDDSFPKQASALEDYLATLDTKQASQVRSSGTFTADGHLRATWVDTPWAKGARVPTNGDPEIPRTDKNPVNSFDQNWAPYQELYRRHSDDSPLAWQGGGRVVDGVIGAVGRALYLPQGQEAKQELQRLGSQEQGNGITISFRAKTRAKGKLVVRVADDATQEFTLTPTMAEYRAQFPRWGPALTLSAREDEVWVDGLRMEGARVENGEFERGERDSEAVAGLYMDSFEGWDSHELNFRQDHLRLSDYPLTFDALTGRTAQVIMFHNYEFAAEAVRRLRARGHILMANTVLYQWPWSAHFVDVLGIEMPWGQWATSERLDYLRTMAYHKPYCFLLNVRFETFRGEKVAEYFARCFAYGFWPGFFSHDAANAPYWESGYYEEDRPLFVKYMRPQQRVTAAGWEPVTLATVNTPQLIVERWGGGPYLGKPLSPRTFYLTIHNPTNTTRTLTLQIPSTLRGDQDYVAFDLLEGKVASMSVAEPLAMSLGAHESAGLYFVARERAAVENAYRHATNEILSQLAKYTSYGLVPEPTMHQAEEMASSPSQPSRLADFLSQSFPNLPPLYQLELQRAIREWRVWSGVYGEVTSQKRFRPTLPPAVVPNELVCVRVNEEYAAAHLALVYIAQKQQREVTFQNGAASFRVPANLPVGQPIAIVIRNADPRQPTPYYETTLPVLPALTVGGMNRELLIRDEYELTFDLTNNLSEPLRGQLLVEVPDGIAKPAPQEIELAPWRPTQVQLPLRVVRQPDEADVTSVLKIRWQSSRASTLVEIPLTILARKSSILRSSHVRVRVDSCYLGYSPDPLTDGVVDTRGVEWQNAAWASDEGLVPHWVEFNFDKPTPVSEIVLYWAFDDGKYWTSRKVHVQVPDANGTWKSLATVKNEQPTAKSVVTFGPVTITKLRVYQEPGDGPAARKGILWLAEVEAR
ncbi:MAG: hypothetical protein KatS3mg130_0197 [Candidatus Sumerlaea sp.]|uniref:Uncharacterized protein n=1 Tax=Sumerlaea chitinivorans TaxID=2250252 RepID=A0A2Z4Y8I2_SUMC1|nr:hypothetical protein BRCON_2594 [Candidatus Sumerlaea chitinivorans]GIX43789.1 MAG: hypothetical protein KatS3mg130_0197 [Candidatus Sumerlaea sp.]